MSEIRVDSIGNESNTGGPVLSGITTFSGQQYFIPPTGTTAERPSDCPPGSIRFNTDSSKLEYWQGTAWLEFEASSEELGGEDLAAPYNESANRVSTTATYAAYGTVAENATGYTLPMSNPSHYGGKARDLQTGGFKITLSGNSASEDFFMGCWIKFDTYSTDRQMGIDLFGDYVYFETRSSGDIAVRHNGGSRADSSGGTNLNDGNWHHIALSRTGDTLYGFVDGTAEISTTSGVSNGTNSVQSNENFWFFGGSGSSYNTDAQVIDVFVYGGSGVTSYTTPTAPLISSSGSINHFSGFSDSDALYISAGVTVGSKSPSSNQGTGTRGVVGGANPAPTFTNAIDYLTMSTLGNSQEFGDLIDGPGMKGSAMSSRTRCVFAGGYTGTGKRNVMEFVTMSSTGNAIDFGDQTVHGSTGRTSCIGLSNSTRGIMAGGQNSNGSPYYTNGISYITIASTGNDIDFGDANNSGGGGTGCGSPVRGVYQLGGNPRPIDYITFSTTGNAQDFGDLAENFGGPSGASNAIRGVFGGGNNNNNINYITIATTGNAQDFGDLTLPRFEIVGLGSPTRAVFAGGSQEPASPFISNRIDYVEIMTTGNAVQFGDLSYITGQGRQPQGGSNGHGGLS